MLFVVPTPETSSTDLRPVSFAHSQTAVRSPHASPLPHANELRASHRLQCITNINLNCLLELLALRSDALAFNQRAAQVRFSSAIAQRQTDLHSNFDSCRNDSPAGFAATVRSRRASPVRTVCGGITGNGSKPASCESSSTRCRTCKTRCSQRIHNVAVLTEPARPLTP